MNIVDVGLRENVDSVKTILNSECLNFFWRNSILFFRNLWPIRIPANSIDSQSIKSGAAPLWATNLTSYKIKLVPALDKRSIVVRVHLGGPICKFIP